jgi:hypothetical protein
MRYRVSVRFSVFAIPNFVVEWLALLLRIISARRPAILKDGFRGFSQYLQANVWIVS